MVVIGRNARQLGEDETHNLTHEEVRILWSFVHGDIMNPGVRAQLYGYWGLCERHSWAYAVVEIELWESGGGARGGHQPFDVSVLYADLLARMRAEITRAHRRHGQLRAITRSGVCVVCADIASEEPAEMAVTHAGMDLEKLTAEANRMEHTKSWLDETMRVWGPRVCPSCRRESVPEGEGQLCRMHLERILEQRAIDGAALTAYLEELERSVRQLTDSMTQDGKLSSPEADASWVGALAWFNNWTFPLRMTGGRERQADSDLAE
jgi:hypothetical protein